VLKTLVIRPYIKRHEEEKRQEARKSNRRLVEEGKIEAAKEIELMKETAYVCNIPFCPVPSRRIQCLSKRSVPWLRFLMLFLHLQPLPH
jgi:hypothetical protein